jgi:acyl transferase domain-containing protein
MPAAFMFPGMSPGFPSPFAHYPLGQRIASQLAERIDTVCAAYGWPSVLSELDPHSWRPVDELRAYHLQLCCRSILEQQFGLSADVLVGHSLGEFTSLVTAGAFTVEDGARLLCERVRALQACARPTGANAAFMVSREEAEAFAEQDADVVVAAVNSPAQVVLTGPAEQIQRLLHAAESRGISAKMLRIGPYAQHHPSHRRAFEEYLAAVADIRPGPLRTAVYSTILGRRLGPDDDLIRVTALQLVRPLDFARAATELRAEGVDLFVECGLKNTLSRLVTDTLGDSASAWSPFRKRLTDVAVRDMSASLDKVKPTRSDDGS